MKKICIICFLFIFSIISVNAKEQKDYFLKFNGERYNLLYSVKSPDFGGYLNEYFRPGETYNLWTDMVAVHHFPNAYSPIDRIREFKEYLSSIQCPSSLTFDDKKNTAMIDFVMISGNNMPVILEFNVFKYEKSKKCGSIAIQYAKRYKATNAFELEEIKKAFEKSRSKIIKEIKRFEIPQVVTQDIDKCISLADLQQEAKAEVALNDEQNKTDQDNNENEDVASGQSSEDIVDEKENNIALKSEECDKHVINVNNSNVEINENTNPALTENVTDEDTINNAADVSNTQAEVNVSQNNIHEQIKQINSNYGKKDNDNENLSLNEEHNSDTIQKEESSADDNLQQDVQEIESQSEESIQVPVTDADTNIDNDDLKSVKITVDKVKCKKHAKNKDKDKSSEYVVVNDKAEYIATPRTLKELKRQTKSKKKTRRSIKKRAKNAEKKLLEG